MTILELQKELQEIYEKYGDIEVVTKEPDWRYSECYYNIPMVNLVETKNGKLAVL